MSVNFIYLFILFLFIYFVQGRSENHFCDNAPSLKIIIIIIIIIIVIIIITLIIWLFVHPRNWTQWPYE